MPEEVYPNLFRIKIPLPESPLKYLNSYVIKGGKRNLVIDTGLNRKECKTAMLNGLDKIGVDLSTLDIFITHLHADHFGLISELASSTTQIYFNLQDTEVIENWQGFEPMIQFAEKNGFPKNLLRSALNNHPGLKYGTHWKPVLNILKDNDKLDVGSYSFTCIQTPGHTNGHTCLYEDSEHIFISGDHILHDITPNIQCWWEDDDPLNDYLKSLEKVYPLKVKKVLPGHRRLFSNFRKRIDELKHHHDLRLAEIMDILSGSSSMSAYEVASKMKWDINAASWEDFPVQQKWFATGEALSHLRYLENKNTILRQTEIPVVTFVKLDDPAFYIDKTKG